MNNNTSTLANSCVLLVQSCDAYEDVWEMFFSALADHWKHCDLEIILNTETKTTVFSGLNINTRNYCGDYQAASWGDRLLHVLSQVDKEYVVTLFDDFILEGEVNETKLNHCLTLLEANQNIAAFYFNNIPGESSQGYEGFRKLGKTTDYKVNSCPAIWRKSALEEVTGKIDSPWAWEFFGSVRAYGDKYEYYCAEQDCENTFIYQYQLGGAIRRGKWVEKVCDPAIQKYNLQLDPLIRGYASESLSEGKYSLKWKIDFMLLGLRMVGPRALIPLLRGVMSKVKRVLR
ncbi:hypothetical protein [Vibrio ulleungensis]|uniref:Glycosyltransferase n=1 Tax=Vibrio ulleungensis TaxID=2807619 RepID=A0ABS2HJM1_9VIBR|nr:hypothetical protein [Vibrio ulleungensis]MBM7037715.1 hypothetical protein [Vibrio ulleungensis]